MFATGTHKTLSPSLETIGAAFAIFELPPDAPAQAALVSANAKIWAERTRALLASEPVIGPGDESIAVTASFGLAPLQRSTPMPEDMITRADHALYRAKQTGRNLVVSA